MDPQAPGTVNSTKPQWPQPLETIARNKELLLLQTRMVLTAIGVIYVGAHATLRRPPSAAPRSSNQFAKDKDGKKKKKKQKEDAQFVEGFQASDAILFPILAGFTLVGLYYLIQWMEDPKFINKIISSYFSIASLFSLGKMLGDTMHFATSFIFPNVWRDSKGNLWRFDSVHQRQLARFEEVMEGSSVAPADSGKVGSTDHNLVQHDIYRDESGSWRPDEQHLMPFPGRLSTLKCSEATRNKLWALRLLVKEHWTVNVGLHGFGKSELQLTLCDVLGLVAAAIVAATYQYTGDVVLSNIMGLGMCYGAFQLMSPTSFAIGTMVLAGLFVYDIVMVFYTPYMITVATKVDAPIKLTFGEPKRGSMLGLGDIVLPGIFMCLCLRFDLWRHYQSKIKKTEQKLSSELADRSPMKKRSASNNEGVEDKNCTKEVTRTVVGEIVTIHTKAEYIDPQGRWGDRLWTTALGTSKSTVGLESSQFAKTYFMAAIWGYSFGMALTISMLLIFNHGQPALLYLVPCVTGAAWLTGLVKGEVAEMWSYTEDGSLDIKEVVITVDADGKAIEEAQVKGDDAGKASDKLSLVDNQSAAMDPESKDKPISQDEAEEARREGHDVFMFILRAPGAEEMDDFDV